MIKGHVLLLNGGTWEPLTVVSIPRAINLLLAGKAVVVEETGRFLRTVRTQYPVPSVIALRRFINVPRRHAHWSRQGVLVRDKFVCIYCGARVGDIMRGKPLSRRDFTRKWALAVLAGATITLTGCDSDSPTAPSNGSNGGGGGGGNSDDETGTVSANHGHQAVITSAELAAGNAITLDITGTADHPHTVMLTMDEVAMIAAGDTVVKTSSTDAGHLHTVTFS